MCYTASLILLTNGFFLPEHSMPSSDLQNSINFSKGIAKIQSFRILSNVSPTVSKLDNSPCTLVGHNAGVVRHVVWVLRVSVLTYQSGVVLHLQVMNNRQTSEIQAVRQYESKRREAQ